MTAAKPAPPKGIGPAGRAFWRDVRKDYELRPDEARVLERACRSLDLIVRLEGEVARLRSLVVKGARGQLMPHPAVEMLRGERGLFARLLAQLALPDPRAEGGEGAPPGRSTAARELAMQRWGSR